MNGSGAEIEIMPNCPVVITGCHSERDITDID
jgi:hypothetical protein